MSEESFSYTSIISLLSASVTTDNTLAEGRHTATRLFLCKDNRVARLHAEKNYEGPMSKFYFSHKNLHLSC